MRTSTETATRGSTYYSFHSLHALPCGCVTAVYRTHPQEVEVVALEARGPHCVHIEHEIGSVLGLEIENSDRLS